MCLLLMCEMTQIINGEQTYRQWRVSNTVFVVIVVLVLCFIGWYYPIRKMRLIVSMLTDMLSLTHRAEHGRCRIPIILCCLSMSHAESPQIPFTLHSSEAAMYSSASARAELKLLSLF